MGDFPPNPPADSGWNNGERSPVILRYIGGSMLPTFREGDELLVIPLGDAPPRRGDVIAFNLQGEERTIVHRVESVGSDGIRTRGDASGIPDSWILQPSHIRGRVEFVRSDRGWSRGRNGTTGTVQAGTIALWRWLRGLVTPVLSPVYRSLSSSRILKGLGSTLPTELTVYQRSQGPEYQLRLFGLIIGRCLPGRKRWRIRTPFHLVVDERHLPVSSGQAKILETAE
ncbi:MAG: S24/S26 family peptidase [Methanomicrobiales archaeon]|nr:S24/S26 family peptidase [Methanomicrobiales archaeon]